MANYNDIKNDLAEHGFNDDAGELTDKAFEEQGKEDIAQYIEGEPYYFSSLINPYTEEEPEPLTGDLYEPEKEKGGYYPFVVLSIPTHTPLSFDYTDEPESVENCDYYDGREIKVVVCQKAFPKSVVEAWKVAQIKNFVGDYGHEPFLQEKF